MIAITGGTINTITKGIIEHGTILVENGKIAAIGADLSIPENAKIIDASGCYVMPGLIDCHTHLCLMGEPKTMPMLQSTQMSTAVQSLPM